MGLVNRTLVHPREIFSDPLKDRAAAVLIVSADIPIAKNWLNYETVAK